MKNGEVQEPTGMTVYVMRDKDDIDCTNGGISSRYGRLFDDESVGEEDFYVQIVAWYGYYKAVPRYHRQRERENGPMFGGNFITSTHPRWLEKYPHPIKIHDRYEEA